MRSRGREGKKEDRYKTELSGPGRGLTTNDSGQSGEGRLRAAGSKFGLERGGDWGEEERVTAGEAGRPTRRPRVAEGTRREVLCNVGGVGREGQGRVRVCVCACAACAVAATQ